MKILISTSSFGKGDTAPLDLLRQEGADIILNPYGRQLTIAESVSLLSGIDGMIAGTEKLNEEVLSAAGNLKYIVRLGTGMDNVDFRATEQLGIKVENTPNAHVDSVAELALGGILSCLRRISFSDRQMRQGSWVKPMGSLLKGKTIGILGLGKVAKRLVTLLQPFGCTILAYDPMLDHSFAATHALSPASQERIFSEADIISLHLPYSAESHHLIHAGAFRMMKKNVVLVNTARGGLINEEDLYNFLSNNQEATAYLDTFETEPYPGKLTKLDNTLLSAHVGTYANEVRKEMELEAAQKILKFFRENGS